MMLLEATELIFTGYLEEQVFFILKPRLHVGNAISRNYRVAVARQNFYM